MKLTDTQLVVLAAAANRPGRVALPLPEAIRGGAAGKVVGGLLRRDLVTEDLARIDEPRWRDTDAGPTTLRITRQGLAAIGVEPEDEAGAAPETGDDAGEVEATAPAREADTGREEAGAAQEAAPSGRTSRAAGLARRRLATARGALEAVCSHWSETGRLDEALLASCRATMAELQRADAKLAAEAPAPGAGGEPRAGTKQARLIEMLRRPEGATIAQIAESSGWQPHSVRGAIAGALKRKLGLTVTSEKPENGERIYRLQPD